MKTFINGAGGRIGRTITHELVNHIKEKEKRDYWRRTNTNSNALSLVGLNEPRGIDYVLKTYKSRDPVHGLYPWDVKKLGSDRLGIDDIEVAFFAEKDISKIPFQDLGAKLLLECSGFYQDPKIKDKTIKLTSQDNPARKFLDYGIETVIQTYPANTADISMIMGVNQDLYDKSNHEIISNASCTTKSLAAPLKILIDNKINIYALLMDTVHAATASQGVLETLSQILTHSTGAAKATGLVIPILEGKMFGMSYRVPTLDGSFSNLYFVAASDEELTKEKINNLIIENVKNPIYANRIGIHDGKDVGTFDIIGRRENSVFIPSKTNVIQLPFGPEGKKASLVSIVSGYDNELGSSVDPILLAEYISRKN
jgi:glyceraldehyde 3-phosphate dehydrogenase